MLRAEVGDNVLRCYQCAKCTSGCPLADRFDLTPNQVMRAVQLDDARVLRSRAIWLCASCYTCATRCPRGIDVTGVMNALRVEARRRGVKPVVPDVFIFNTLFMRLVGVLGRLPEALLMVIYNLIRGKPMADAALGWALLKRRRLKLMPKFVRPSRAIAPLADAGAKVGYFPGCASEGSAAEYDHTARAAARALGIDLVEPEGWTCCGSSPAHATDADKAVAMPMRAIVAVERMGLATLTSPCSACFGRLKYAEHVVASDPIRAASAAAATGHAYAGSVRVLHLLDTFMERAGPKRIAGRVKRPLAGLKVACYYGCLITRPARVTGAEHPEYPVRLDHLIRALGAEPVPWSSKVDCCGGSLGVTQTAASLKLSKRILDDARARGADTIATMCPMCHMNLDARQSSMGVAAEIPILHATQLMVLAFGLGEHAALLDKNIVDPRPRLAEKGLVATA
jgi:heterodisulfide reductase subunit B